MEFPTCKLAYQFSVSLNVLVKKSARRGVALRLGLDEQAGGKMFTSVGMDRNVVDLGGYLGGASVISFPPEGWLKGGFERLGQALTY